jgi:hypothetical protein
MAPYKPPNSHYSEMDVSEYDKERKAIEIWGPYHTHQNKQSEHVIRCELDYFQPKLEESTSIPQSENVQETTIAC